MSEFSKKINDLTDQLTAKAKECSDARAVTSQKDKEYSDLREGYNVAITQSAEEIANLDKAASVPTPEVSA